MKWFKHDTDANMDAKLQEVLLDYGLEGYGLYWYCIELIAGKVDAENLTFSLEHDSRIIARNTGCTPQKVTEMMTRFVDLGLFQDNGGLVTCLRLAKRLDKSMTSNPEMRVAIENMRKSHDSIMTQSGKVMQDKNRLEEKRIDKTNTSKPKACKLDWGSIELTEQQKDDIKGIRVACKKKLTQLALNAILKEFDIARMAGIDYQESIEIWALRGWVAYKAEWALNHKGKNNGQQSFGNKAALTNLGDTDF